MILQASHTHLYPGLRGRLSGVAQTADIIPGRECLVEFSDGSATTGRIAQTGSGWQLDAHAYRTRAGTAIGDKSWLLELDRVRGRIEFRVTGKAR